MSVQEIYDILTKIIGPMYSTIPEGVLKGFIEELNKEIDYTGFLFILRSDGIRLYHRKDFYD